MIEYVVMDYEGEPAVIVNGPLVHPKPASRY